MRAATQKGACHQGPHRSNSRKFAMRGAWMTPLQIVRLRLGLLFLAFVAFGAAQSAAAAPSGRAIMAWHVTISPAWFDPSTAPPQITPFGMLYAIHDALVRPYPGHKMGPSLAESWQESPDGKTYEFKLRPGLKFHNGES